MASTKPRHIAERNAVGQDDTLDRFISPVFPMGVAAMLAPLKWWPRCHREVVQESEASYGGGVAAEGVSTGPPRALRLRLIVVQPRPGAGPPMARSAICTPQASRANFRRRKRQNREVARSGPQSSPSRARRPDRGPEGKIGEGKNSRAEMPPRGHRRGDVAEARTKTRNVDAVT